MTLMNLIFLGLGYKVVTSALQSTPASAAASPGTAVAKSIAPDAQPGAVVQKGLITPVQRGDGWTGDVRHRKAHLSNQAWDVEDVDTTTMGYLEEIYGARAVLAEADPLTIGPREDRLAKQNNRAKRVARNEAVQDQQIFDAEVAAEYYDVTDASHSDVVALKTRADSHWGRELAAEAVAEQKAKIAERAADDTDARLNEQANQRHGKMLARSIRPRVSVDMDMAHRQEYRGQASRGFTKRPDAGFEKADRIALREGDFSQTEVVPTDNFENNLKAGDLGFSKGQQDWPPYNQQKTMNSDFNGVLVSEKGSPDFSHDIVYEVDSDFGG
jgi:hypothetical protein